MNKPLPKRPTLAQYPYDEAAVPEMLAGLNKLRAVKDRGYAQALLDLRFAIEDNEKDPRFQKRMQHEAEKKLAEEAESLRACCESALQGNFGPEAKDIAETMLTGGFGQQRRDDLSSLRACVSEIRKIPQERRERRMAPMGRRGRDE